MQMGLDLKVINKERNISVEYFYENYVLKNRPVLLQGLASEWALIQHWNLEFFRHRYGDKEFVVNKYIKNREVERMMRMEDYIDYIQNVIDDNPWYLRNWNFAVTNPELLSYYETPKQFNCLLSYISADIIAPLKWILIGPVNSFTAFHQDVFMTHSWNVLLYGQKQWLFAEPANRSIEPNLSANETCNKYFAIQNPGDVIFTPSGWFHFVKNKKTSIALTENYVDTSNLNDFLSAFIEHKVKNANTS